MQLLSVFCAGVQAAADFSPFLISDDLRSHPL